MTRNLAVLVCVIVVGCWSTMSYADWKQAQGPLKTKWTTDASPTNALPEYPRPQLVREKWLSLNGLWQFAPAKENEEAPTGKDLAEQILVPYPMESALSGIMRHEDRVWYRRSFELPKDWQGKNVLLHLDAVNWEATVYINGKKLGKHLGGYDAFGYNIASFLNESGPQEIIVGVVNTPDQGNHARGKQTMKPGGIWYTPASGIWQTVWIEPVEKAFVEAIHAEPNIDESSVHITGKILGDLKATVKVEVTDGDKVIGEEAGTLKKGLTIKLPGAKLWSPDSPFLYGLKATVTSKGAVTDTVQSYFGMRKVSMAKDDKGFLRPMLNNQFVFQVGPLDQGFWPDGIYTAPTDAALRSDIEIMKKLGFNMARKHVKIEPERWYYWCDKLGLLVWQDMPSMRTKPDADQSTQFEHELDRMVAGRGNHPSIIMWVVFNEGWGQHDTERFTQHVKELDPTRLVNNASGWTDMKVGDVIDMHHYPDPAMPKPEETRAAVLGEFGGLGLGLQGHTWTEKSWGYRGVGGPDQLTASYERMLAKGWRLKDQGLCAVVYTQITDVETECNGLLTYDRQVVKPDVDRLHAVNTGHIDQIPEPKVIVPTAAQHAVDWRYTIELPSEHWMNSDFNDADWKKGPGGFGTAKTPGAVIGTEWKSNDIWLRREIELPADKLHNPQLLLHHDDDVEVYLNGVLAFKEKGYYTEYKDAPIAPEALATLHPGKNLLAIHCHQHTGGQFIDAGLTVTK